MESGRRRHHNPPPPGGGREDCWSEGATAALVEAWGDRYLQLSRGNLRQKDWSEVADAVNARQDTLGKPRKSDVQCKNRVDTIKKKYKAEKSRPGPSQWPFFPRLDLLVGSADAIPKPAPHARPKHPSPAAFIAKHPGRAPATTAWRDSPLSTESSRDIASDDDDGGYVKEEDNEEEEDEIDDVLYDAVTSGKRRRWGGFGGRDAGGGGGGAFGELAKAVLRFADVYEKVESSKQQQLMEMERQRMEFAKELEFQRMQIFMEAQIEIEKVKRPKYASGSGERLQ